MAFSQYNFVTWTRIQNSVLTVPPGDRLYKHKGQGQNGGQDDQGQPRSIQLEFHEFEGHFDQFAGLRSFLPNHPIPYT